jgi:hypothetical protein
MAAQASDMTISHIKEEEEHSSSDSENEAGKPTSQNLSHRTSSVKKQDHNPFAKGQKDDKGFDELNTKFNYSKVNSKRDDKKFDELTARYDYSRVATKRPTMLEKQYNMSNNNLLKKEQEKKTTGDSVGPKRNDLKQTTTVRRPTKPGGTVVGMDKGLLFGKNNSGLTTNKNETEAGSKPQDNDRLNSMGESQVKRRNDKRVSMAVNPVKRDMNAMSNNNKNLPPQKEEETHSQARLSLPDKKTTGKI